MTLSPISIIIPVYKNFSLFFQNLKRNKKYFDKCEIIIINDFPNKSIASEVKKIIPQVKIIENKKNLGFAGSVNIGIKNSKRPYFFLINSDVILKDDSFKKTINYFKKDKKLFAIGLAQKEKDGKIVGANFGYFQNGLIQHSARINFDTTQSTKNFWVEAGASIYRRDLFIKLGMMDELFSPFYWEDIDISYRAWKAGYEIKFDPSIVVEHHHESTIGKYFDKKTVLKIAFRNQLIFHWKNLTDKDLIINHLIHLPKYIFTPGFFDALIRLPQILQARKKIKEIFKKKDKEILNLFS